MLWIDTHCHLDAPEFLPFRHTSRAQDTIKKIVIPAVHVSNFSAVRALAHAGRDGYGLGIHPLYVKDASEHDLLLLEQTLAHQQQDPHLVAVGEIGLDFYVPELSASPWRERQQHFYIEQLRLARQYELPVLLHVRRSVDAVLKGLRQLGKNWLGIAHAFNGSEQQAKALIDLGFKLGFGGAVTFERALHLRRLIRCLPLESIVLETDAPDMPPRWIYQTALQRASGEPQAINSPAQLPRIGAEIAALRGMAVEELAQTCAHNALCALPKLRRLD